MDAMIEVRLLPGEPGIMARVGGSNPFLRNALFLLEPLRGIEPRLSDYKTDVLAVRRQRRGGQEGN